MSCFAELALLALAVITSSVNAQDPTIANDDPCAADLTVPSPSDNLSCEFVSPGGTFCYSRSELCNGNLACLTGSDEGANIAALDCDRGVFACTSGEDVNLDQLCDGNRDCGGGDDETTPLCENKCRTPYYGGCPFTRECITSALDVNCGACLSGYVDDPNNPGGTCLPSVEIALQAASYNAMEGTASVMVCAEVISGTIDAGETRTATLETSPGTASSEDFGELNPPATLTFTSAQTVDCASITIVDDDIVEGATDEFFSVILGSNDIQVVIGSPNSANVFIADNDNAVFEFTQNTYFGVENVASPPDIPFSIRLASNSGTLSEATTVTVTSGGGSASEGVDYFPVNVQFTFPAGSGPFTALSSALDPIDDNRVEANENAQLTATITAGSGSFTINGGNTATVVIQNDDVLPIGFEPLTYSVNEIDGLVEVCFEVQQDFVLDIPAQATLNTQSGTAVSPADFSQLLNVVVNLPVGTGQNEPFCQTIIIVQDGIPENLESFTVQLTSNSANALSVLPALNTATVNINGDRIVFALSQDNYNVNEAAGTVEVCVDLTSGVLSALTPIVLTPQTGTASASDFTNAQQTVNFPAGSSPPTQQCADFPITNEDLVEFDEFFIISASSNDVNVEFNPGDDSSTVTIQNDDIAQFQFTQATYVVGEDTGPGQPAIVLIFGELTFPIDVQVATVQGGTATSGEDFMSVLETLTFPAGASPANLNNMMSLNVPIIDDGLVEGDETINLMANSQSNFADVNPDSAILVIDDNDELVVGFEQLLYSPFETDPFVTVCFVIEEGVLDVNIDPAVTEFTTDGTAMEPADYIAVARNFGFLIGAGPGDRFCEDITINDDGLAEGSEQFTVTLQSLSTQLVVVSPDRDVATIEILDDDDVVFELEELEYGTTEGGVTMVMVCVNQISGILVTRSIQVDVQPKPIDPLIDTATAGTDYDAFTSSLVFPSGSTPGARMCFDIQQFISDDQFVEFTENFRIMLSTNDSSAEFTPGRDCATVNINDNDQVTVVLVPPPGTGIPSYATPEDTPTGSQEVCVMIVGAPPNVLQRPVTLTLESSDGPAGVIGAQSPADYGAINAPIIYNPGQEDQQMCREIPIFDDIICEDDEFFNIALSTADDGVNLNPATSLGTVTIIDNDVATISADQIEYIVNEQDDLWITLHLDGQKGEGRECVVSVMTVDGSATDGQDYVGIAGEYVFNSTTFTHRVFLDIINDRICEGDENFDVFLSTSSPDCQVGTPQLSVTIRDDEIGMGDDPHFSIYLPSGEMLCYTVQGEHGFSFNLINNKQLIMNAKFVPDARREEVTWLGSMGIIIQNSYYGGSNDTKLRFEAQEKTLYINDKVALSAKNIEKLTFSNGKMTISEATPKHGFHYPSVMVDLKDVEISFTIKYTNQHLDMFWHSTGKKVANSHGLIGQFFRNGVEVDTVRKILIMPDKEPVPVMRRPVWSFMERETADDQLCWTAMNPGYQGEGLIDGTYLDYLVDDVMGTEFKFKQ